MMLMTMTENSTVMQSALTLITDVFHFGRIAPQSLAVGKNKLKLNLALAEVVHAPVSRAIVISRMGKMIISGSGSGNRSGCGISTE